MQTISQFSSNFHGISQISAPFRAPKYTPKSSKNRFWELVATIWPQLGAARSNLDGFWAPWARFFIDLAAIFEWIERGFCKQSLDEQYALVAALNMALLLSHCIFSLTSGAAGCASRLRRLPNGECTACWIQGHLLNVLTWTWHKFKKKIQRIPQRLSSDSRLEIDACWPPPIL